MRGQVFIVILFFVGGGGVCFFDPEHCLLIYFCKLFGTTFTHPKLGEQREDATFLLAPLPFFSLHPGRIRWATSWGLIGCRYRLCLFVFLAEWDLVLPKFLLGRLPFQPTTKVCLKTDSLWETYQYRIKRYSMKYCSQFRNETASFPSRFSDVFLFKKVELGFTS